ncbi:hypothetical protein QFZ23_003636 [Arthrobacter globiformis]|uniref:hypothetical protein n=1 Tax=Arthrobacter globiformis TaxID=1665 RepID=UPI002781F7A7|nr:hypothetical protein [Arthrobacter globiformis]MDQ1059735.1 hypothetical protein [Arthrobacter globiformis]
MSELDLGLKVGTRRLFWDMGLSTRLDVELRGHKAANQRGGAQSFTDLDVLGISISPDVRLTTLIADCKTSRRDSTSRMFWVKGVADFFGADHAYLVREHEVTDAARQLSARLGIGILTSPELERLQTIHDPSPNSDSAGLAVLFDRRAVANHLSAFNGLNSKLNHLLDFSQFDYWVNASHRNPTQLAAHMSKASKLLNPGDPAHRAVVLDLCWLYLLSLTRITGYVRGGFLGDPDRAVQEYLFGGPSGLEEKRVTAALLNRARPAGTQEMGHLPSYYRPMLELVTRLLKRPQHLQASLRYIEVATAFATAADVGPVPQALKQGTFDPIAAKLAADVCGFITDICGLDPKFRFHARRTLLGEEPSAAPTLSAAPKGQPSKLEPSGTRMPQPGSAANRSHPQLSLLDLEDWEPDRNYEHEHEEDVAESPDD